MITENLEQVRKNIDEACRMAGRDPKEVTLIAVSKTKPVSMLKEAYGSRVRIFANVIPISVRAAEISAEGVSIYKHDPEGKVASAYDSLTKEVLADGQ